MKNILKSKKLYKRLIFLFILIYVLYIFINQQKTLNAYKTSQDYYTEQINSEKAYGQTLYALENNVNSKEYIESVAREKLDMYFPNERVYIDKGT